MDSAKTPLGRERRRSVASVTSDTMESEDEFTQVDESDIQVRHPVQLSKGSLHSSLEVFVCIPTCSSQTNALTVRTNDLFVVL